jgi:hypothetical protein
VDHAHRFSRSALGNQGNYEDRSLDLCCSLHSDRRFHARARAGGFSNLAGVAMLLSNRWLLLAGWVHYLAFDILIGSWELEDAREHGIPHLIVVPCLLLTFMFGPAGWVLYRVVRSIAHRSPGLLFVRNPVVGGQNSRYTRRHQAARVRNRASGGIDASFGGELKRCANQDVKGVDRRAAAVRTARA